MRINASPSLGRGSARKFLMRPDMVVEEAKITGGRINLKFSYTDPILLHRAKQMARLSSVCPVGIPQHVIQRGNDRQVCFASEQDFVAYAGWLKDSSKKYQVDIHAWVLMTNHVHLLCTPRADNAISHMMQSLGRQIQIMPCTGRKLSYATLSVYRAESG